MKKTKHATRDDWEIQPLPAKRTVIALDRAFSQREMRAIRRGLIPEQMEDKWFIFFEDDVLYFHRSWTGHCACVVHFCRDAGELCATQAEVNRDPDQYIETDDARDKELLLHLIDVLLLHKDSDYPKRGAREDALEHWGTMGRAMLGEGPDPGEG